MRHYALYIELCKKQKKMVLLGYSLMVIEALLVAGLPFLLNAVFDLLFTISDQNYLLFISLFSLYAILVCIQFALSISSMLVFKIIGNKNSESIGQILTQKIYHTRKKTPPQLEVGDILQGLQGDIFGVGESGITLLYEIAHTTVCIIALFIFMISVNWQLAFILFISFAILMACQNKLNRKAETLIDTSRNSSGKYEYINSKFAQRYHDYRAIDCYDYYLQSYIRILKKLLIDRLNVTMLFTKSGTVSGIWTIINMILVLLFGAHGVVTGGITLGALFTFNAYSNNIGGYLLGIPDIISSYKQFSVSYNRLLKLTQTEQFNAPKNSNKHECGNLVLSNIKFDFENKPIFDGVNYQFNFGKMYAITGANGVGKTTLLNILMGEYDLTQGTLEWSGKTISPRNDRMSFLGEISYYSANIVLFNDSVLNNITLADTINSNRLNEIVDVLNMHDINLDTVIDEMQEQYSAGQLQKIALARCLLSNRTIIILDELEKHLDTSTQLKVLEYLNSIKNSKIIIIVSHDSKTTKRCDKELCVEGGKIVEK